jgi:hypothetical protein
VKLQNVCLKKLLQLLDAIINKALVDSRSLNDIDLSGNNLHDSSASAIAALIRRHSARRDDEYWASCLRSGGEEGLVPRGPNPSVDLGILFLLRWPKILQYNQL